MQVGCGWNLTLLMYVVNASSQGQSVHLLAMGIIALQIAQLPEAVSLQLEQSISHKKEQGYYRTDLNLLQRAVSQVLEGIQ